MHRRYYWQQQTNQAGNAGTTSLSYAKVYVKIKNNYARKNVLMQ
jgi:hypothetical protein